MVPYYGKFTSGSVLGSQSIHIDVYDIVFQPGI